MCPKPAWVSRMQLAMPAMTVDCDPRPAVGGRGLEPEAAQVLEHEILALPGVVDTGLFLGIADRVWIGRPDGTVDVRVRSSIVPHSPMGR